MKRNSNYFAQQAESLIFQDCFSPVDSLLYEVGEKSF